MTTEIDPDAKENQGGGPKPLPAGGYLLRCNSLEWKHGKQPPYRPYLRMQWEVVAGPHAGKKRYFSQGVDGNVEMNRKMIAGFARAVGHGRFTLDAATCERIFVGAYFKATINCKPDRRDPSQMQNDIGFFVDRDKLTPNERAAIEAHRDQNARPEHDPGDFSDEPAGKPTRERVDYEDDSEFEGDANFDPDVGF